VFDWNIRACVDCVISVSADISFTNQEVFQIDMVPLLSLMLGLPIPQNNLGVLPLDALELLPDRVKLQWMYINLQQLLNVFNLNHGEKQSCNIYFNTQISFYIGQS